MSSENLIKLDVGTRLVFVHSNIKICICNIICEWQFYGALRL